MKRPRFPGKHVFKKLEGEKPIMKKIISLALALLMILSLATTAFAAMEGTLTGGSITIKDAVDGQTYNAYQILYLESYHVDNAETGEGQYAYKANSKWADWLATQTDYVAIDGQGYVTWVAGADVAEFAKLAQAQLSGKTADATATASGGSATLTVEGGLKLGYYLVDTTLGTLCSLDTTNPTVEMEEKNEAPTSDKTVKVDASTWGDTNTATIGDKVEYKVEIVAKKGAAGYVLHDSMDDGLTFNNDITVAVGGTSLTVGTEYEVVTTGLSDGCDFEVTFKQNYLDTITTDTTIVVTYSATLNETAVIAGGGNKNTSKLEYGEDPGTGSYAKPTTLQKIVTTKTFEFDLVKTDNDNKLLVNAEFELYKADQSTKISLVKNTDGTYRVAKADETGVTTIVVDDGNVTIQGLGNGTYYLKEIKAPAGYNLLTGFTEVKIADKNLNATVADGKWTEGGIQIINQSGTELPSTGGMGTTLFYILGGMLTVGALVLLVTKKRMNAA